MPKGQRKQRTPQEESWSAVTRIIKLAEKVEPDDLAVVISKLTAKAQSQ